MIYTIGEWWLCPHGFGNNLQRPMEPGVDEMIGTDPVSFTTIGEKVRYMDRNAIIPRSDNYRPSPQTPELPRAAVHEAIRETLREVREGRYR